jgi:hypothetical protein
VREIRPPGSVRGVLSNEHSYRDSPREWSQRSSRLFLPPELADEGLEGRREKEPEAGHANHTEMFLETTPGFGADALLFGADRDPAVLAHSFEGSCLFLQT